MGTTGFPHINLSITDDAAIAEVVMMVDGLNYGATGTARRHPSDQVNDGIGARLAVSRALRVLARQIANDAHAEIRAEDRRQAAQADARRRQLRRNADRRRRDAVTYAEVRALSEARRMNTEITEAVAAERYPQLQFQTV